MNLQHCLYVIFLLCFTSINKVIGQIVFEKKIHDMGIITGSSNDYLDIVVTNKGKEKVYIFRTDADKRFTIQYSSKTLHPDSSAFIRVAFSPVKKGPFSETVHIHFSCYTTPLPLILEGIVAELPRSNSAFDCPSFDRHRPNPMPEATITVKVIDSLTREPLAQSVLKIITNGRIQEEIFTNEYGVVAKTLQVGYYYFVASQGGYYPNDLGTYIGRNTKEIIIPLLRMPEPAIEQIVVVTPTSSESKDTLSTFAPPAITSFENDPYPDFPLTVYKPNNLVFVLDISASMRVEGRLDLLKAAMIELVLMLREVDKLTIITYSNKAEVLLDTEFVKDKDVIIRLIQGLTAGGITDGGKGMKMGYDMAFKAFIPGGNNQVIMTTDGAFNTGADNVHTMAQKNLKKGVNMSIVGIKMKETDKTAMHKIAALGEGAFVEVNTFQQTQTVLKEEIRKRAISG
jgi:Ca-activated chloride channel homolog